jgi:hypothetical protein
MRGAIAQMADRGEVRIESALPPEVREELMTLYHGSPHTFDRFSMEHMGTGEGHQAFGWGLYFSEARDVAAHYRGMLLGKGLLVDGAPYQPKNGHEEYVLSRVDDDGRNLEATITDLEAQLASGAAPASTIQPKLDFALSLRGRRFGGGSSLYRVESAPNADAYLLWDKPLSEQSEKVRGALEKAGITADKLKADNPILAASPIWKPSGSGAYKALARQLGSDQAASLALRESGIAGLKFLDQGSRDGGGSGTYNYVLFDTAPIRRVFRDDKMVWQDATKDALSPSMDDTAALREVEATPAPKGGPEVVEQEIATIGSDMEAIDVELRGLDAADTLDAGDRAYLAEADEMIVQAAAKADVARVAALCGMGLG